MKVERVISGGQTGIDRLGLEVAKRAGVATGGWAPKGWLTELGPDPSLAAFGLTEHRSARYPPRTRANVRAADGTVWFGKSDAAGFLCTKKAAQQYDRAWIENPTAEQLVAWVRQHRVRVLNVAGSRGSRLTHDAREVAEAVLSVVIER